MSGQIDIICQDFRTLSENIYVDGSSVATLGTIIERHNRVVIFSRQIGQLFSFIILMQVIANTLIICCLGFVITVVSVVTNDVLINIINYSFFALK